MKSVQNSQTRVFTETANEIVSSNLYGDLTARENLGEKSFL